MVTPRMRRRARLAANIVLLVGLITPSACDRDDGPSGPGSGAAVIAGTVTRQKTGLGVPDLVAVLVKGGRVAATSHTDEAGRFGFGGVAEGQYTVRLTGHDIAGLDVRFDVIEPAVRGAVVPDGDGDLVFTVVGLVAPRVTGEVRCGGQPAAGTGIRVIGGGVDTTVVTDGVGRYGLLDLEPGRYAVIPVDSPCALSPAFHALELRPAQAGTADFAG